MENHTRISRGRSLRRWSGKKDSLLCASSFLDISDSVKLYHELGAEKMMVVREAYFDRGQVLTDELGGFVVKRNGDGLLAVFRTAIDALDCGLRLRANTGHELVTIHVGIDVGQINIAGDDISGDAINFASRLEGIAKRGEIVVSDTVKAYIDDLRAERHAEYKEKWIGRFINIKGYGRRRVWILSS